MAVIRRDPAKIAAHVAAGLAIAKAQAIAKINEIVGVTRQKYITTSPGQDMIYIAKEREALAFLVAPTQDMTSYPLLAAEIGVTAPTAWELAQVWANVSVYWRGIAAQIEGIRMRAIAQVEAASDPQAVTAVLNTFRPN